MFQDGFFVGQHSKSFNSFGSKRCSWEYNKCVIYIVAEFLWNTWRCNFRAMIVIGKHLPPNPMKNYPICKSFFLNFIHQYFFITFVLKSKASDVYWNICFSLLICSCSSALNPSLIWKVSRICSGDLPLIMLATVLHATSTKFGISK